MKEKLWVIEYKKEGWGKMVAGKWYTNENFYQISYKGSPYGFISKEAWDEKKTGEILEIVEQMLNDVHELAIKEKR